MYGASVVQKALDSRASFGSGRRNAMACRERVRFRAICQLETHRRDLNVPSPRVSQFLIASARSPRRLRSPVIYAMCGRPTTALNKLRTTSRLYGVHRSCHRTPVQTPSPSLRSLLSIPIVARRDPPITCVPRDRVIGGFVAAVAFNSSDKSLARRLTICVGAS